MFTSLLNKHTACAWLLPFLIILASCGSQDDKPEPTPQYVVKVKIISTDAGGLGAGGLVSITRLDKPRAVLLDASLPDNGIEEAETITSLKTGETVAVGLGFDKATTGSGIVPRTTSQLRGEIWVNGQLKASAELDRNTPSQNPDYPTNSARYTMGD
ncbi:hypothetical protein [Hymenobacter metallilatus]|uniref:DUF5689 domain-containing protein n=1 Tax=Hymenobacter metallilatus TaxID=2493666 RepID=A0A428J081_9BACT|nr:hypothetical protein [Hymenobacter metallilatus]RSK25224.1 hypothetical protein EI290_17530 [Hymenobacter metallilatus]